MDGMGALRTAGIQPEPASHSPGAWPRDAMQGLGARRAAGMEPLVRWIPVGVGHRAHLSRAALRAVTSGASWRPKLIGQGADARRDSDSLERGGSRGLLYRAGGAGGVDYVGVQTPMMR
jgi:hypothetical protein